MAAGPGPGAYLLPPTVGYPNHDPSRYRNPEYSMAKRLPWSTNMYGPGPTYDLTMKTRYGKATPPAYSLSSRHKQLASFQTPGPGNYNIEPKRKDKPGFTMASRFPDHIGSATPGPNQYSQPSTIGPKVPDKPSSAAYSIIGNHGLSMKVQSPGPANYGDTKLNVFKPKNPQYTMRPRYGGMRGEVNPGPAAYFPSKCVNPSCCTGGYSFGIRTNTSPYITAEDTVPCIERN